MADHRLKGVRLAGIAAVVPPGVRTIEEDRELLGGESALLERLKKHIGIKSRHVTLKDECASDLCEHAARLLLSELDCDPSTVDGLVMVTATPDYFQPATACVLHGRLGLARDAAAFDLGLACSGYIYGLWVSALAVSSGACRRVLLLAGDTISRCCSPRDRATRLLFGDGGSATLIEQDPEAEEISFALRADGSRFTNLIIPAGGFRKRPSPETARMVEREEGNARSEEHLYMNGAEIFAFSISEVPTVIEEVLNLSGWSKEEVDYFILHQGNTFITRNIARRLKVPIDKTPYGPFEKYGNQSSASIPVTLCETLCWALGSRSVKAVLAGFGSGLSWGACTLTLGPMVCLPVAFRDE